MIPGHLEPLANHLWQSTLFAAVAGLLTLALRKNRAHVRYGLWLAASVKFLIPFSILVMVGSHFGRPTMATVPASPGFAFAEQVGQPFAVTIPFTSKPRTRLRLASLVTPILGAAWAIGFVILLFSWWSRWREIRTALRAASAIDGHIVDLPIGVDVMSSPEFREPGVFGIYHPVLLLPAGITGHLTTAQLKAVLTHELCHIRRRDNLATVIHMIVEALFWFHPLVWWLGSRLMQERENACDEAVLRMGSEPVVYAEGILRICELYAKFPLQCVAGVTGANLKKRIEAIMTNRIVHKLNGVQKALLASTGVLAVAGPLAIGLINAPQIRAQAQSSERYAFEVSSVRPHNRETGNFADPQVLPGGRFTSRAPLILVIAFAYNVPFRAQGDSLIFGGPNWINMTSLDSVYDIEATASKQTIPDGLSDVNRTDRVRLMVQALLADRFKLAAHREMKEIPVYVLTVAKGGPKLDKADIEEKDCPIPPQNGRKDANVFCHTFNGGRGRGMHARAVNISDIAAFAGGWADRPIIDKTGLKGLYHLETSPWLPMELGVTAPSPGTKQDGVDVSDLPTLFTLFDRLGLRMESQRDKISSVVIDHVEKPSQN
jgi:uncharacterized protein (TIGR03435 family)